MNTQNEWQVKLNMFSGIWLLKWAQNYFLETNQKNKL
jgi:hypothetical protein